MPSAARAPSPELTGRGVVWLCSIAGHSRMAAMICKHVGKLTATNAADRSRYISAFFQDASRQLFQHASSNVMSVQNAE